MIKKHILFWLVCALVLGVFLLPAQAAEPSKVAIVPFRVNADRDLSFLRDGIVDMLTTRLSWEDKVTVIPREVTQRAIQSTTEPMNETSARKLGEGLGADFVLFGSVTVFGESVSLDAKMVDVKDVKPTVSVFNQSQGMDEVIPKVNTFAADINEKVFGRQVARRQQAPLAAPQGGQPAPNIYAHPEKLLGYDPDKSEVSELNPDFIMSGGRRDSSTFWKSRNFEKYIKSMAIGDVDGDGRKEIVIISPSEILIFRNAESRFITVKEITGKASDSFISADVADINGNGSAEIFVTNLNTRTQSLESFVIEWNGMDFSPISEKNNWYFRVLNLPLRGLVLYGQKRGVADAFLPGVYELDWQGGRLAELSRMSLPREVNVFGFMLGDVLYEGGERVLIFDEEDHLRVLTASGKKEWRSDEPYGGSANYLDTILGPGESTKDEDKQRIYLGQRILIKDLNKDGKQEVFVVKNQGMGSRVFKRFRNFSSGEIMNLSWDGLGLSINWKTRKIQGYVSDFAIDDFDNDGQDEVVAVVVMSKGASLLVKPKSAIISYDLTGPQTDEAQE